jgi:hypothetical protein
MTVEMGSGAVIYVPSFMKIGSGVQKLIGGTYGHILTHRQKRDLISLLYFFKIKKYAKNGTLIYSTYYVLMPLSYWGRHSE